MPKPMTFPCLFNDALQINIAQLKKWGLLTKGQSKQTTLYWKTNGRLRAEISLLVSLQTNSPFVQLNYRYEGTEIVYSVHLIRRPSNLKKGELWYFVCPKTGMKCRKLYFFSGYFLHRKAFTNCMYESQTYSKKYRLLQKTYGAFFRIDELKLALRSKNFKKVYAGKSTKRFQKIQKQLDKFSLLPQLEI